MSIRISAVICTYNRSKLLRKSLDSLIQQTIDASDYEIIVVDNGSTDDTKRVVATEYADVPNLSYVHEPILGISSARNTGWKSANSEYVAYLEDDGIACPTWLETALKVFDSVVPKPGAVGGKVEPIWEIPKPEWITKSMEHSLSILDWSENPIPDISDDLWFIEGNVAYPRALLEELGGFELWLGRKGKKLISCEGNLLNHKVHAKGLAVYYHPEMSIKHFIHASRLNKEWLFQRNLWNGVSLALVDNHINKNSLINRITASCSISKDTLKLWFKKTLGKENNRLDTECNIRFNIGYICGYLGLLK